MPTDASGILTVVEATEDMNATILSVSLPGNTLTTVIYPMAGGFDKASALNTSSSLRGAAFAADEVAGGVLDTQPNGLKSFFTAVGDFFRQVGKVFKDVVKFVKEAAEKVWKFVVQIGEVVLNAVVETVNAVVDGVKWVFDVLKTGWDYVVCQLRDWAGISDWSSLGDVAGKPPADSGQDPSKGLDGTSLLFANHYRNLIQILLDAISDQGEVLSQVFDDLQELLKKVAKFSVTEILKGIAGIIGSAALSSVKVVVDALFRVLISLADSAISLLDAKLHIPIISDILNAIGVPDISILDLFCWIAAVGYTVLYKVIQGKAPFPDTSDVRAMIAAKSWPELQSVFSKKPAAIMDGPLDGLSDIERLMHVTGHSVSGFFLFATNFLAGFEAALPSGDNSFAMPSGIVGLIVFATEAVAANVAPRYPVENEAVGAWFKASSSKFAWLMLNDGRAVGAIIDSILTIPTLCCAGYHFFELSKKPAGQERSAAIIGEVYNIASCTATISYAVTVNLKGPITKPIPIAIMALANVTGAGLQTATF
ncbi:hypothetical protein TGAM01_v209601 [Trichoderma gamsii]|uniref:Uncharacterized protein n=1 Tax=Trichoderma gamsii TaxID=398673 RepID=A0A2P4ZB86_9HYPO|nr:hypothetical protein TGAM01_v209601 [Trichoderma gamsii]PON21570.1 hypothetical protein TGAM01_v209601 [Trichoderma gamsii]